MIYISSKYKEATCLLHAFLRGRRATAHWVWGDYSIFPASLGCYTAVGSPHILLGFVTIQPHMYVLLTTRHMDAFFCFESFISMLSSIPWWPKCPQVVMVNLNYAHDPMVILTLVCSTVPGWELRTISTPPHSSHWQWHQSLWFPQETIALCHFSRSTDFQHLLL